MAASSEVEEAGEEEGDGEEERGGGATNNLVCLTKLCLKISDHRQKIRLASIQNALPSEMLRLCYVSLDGPWLNKWKNLRISSDVSIFCFTPSNTFLLSLTWGKEDTAIPAYSTTFEFK